jgi:hypothetical protein
MLHRYFFTFHCRAVGVPKDFPEEDLISDKQHSHLWDTAILMNQCS